MAILVEKLEVGCWGWGKQSPARIRNRRKNDQSQLLFFLFPHLWCFDVVFFFFCYIFCCCCCSDYTNHCHVPSTRPFSEQLFAYGSCNPWVTVLLAQGVFHFTWICGLTVCQLYQVRLHLSLPLSLSPSLSVARAYTYTHTHTHTRARVCLRPLRPPPPFQSIPFRKIKCWRACDRRTSSLQAQECSSLTRRMSIFFVFESLVDYNTGIYDSRLWWERRLCCICA